MVDWKICIDSPQKRVIDFCKGSITGGDGYGDGDGENKYGWVDGSGRGCGYGSDEGSSLDFGYRGSIRGDGEGCGYGYSNGRGWSSNKW